MHHTVLLDTDDALALQQVRTARNGRQWPAVLQSIRTGKTSTLLSDRTAPCRPQDVVVAGGRRLVHLATSTATTPDNGRLRQTAKKDKHRPKAVLPYWLVKTILYFFAGNMKAQRQGSSCVVQCKHSHSARMTSSPQFQPASAPNLAPRRSLALSPAQAGTVTVPYRPLDQQSAGICQSSCLSPHLHRQVQQHGPCQPQCLEHLLTRLKLHKCPGRSRA